MVRRINDRVCSTLLRSNVVSLIRKEERFAKVTIYCRTSSRVVRSVGSQPLARLVIRPRRQGAASQPHPRQAHANIGPVGQSIEDVVRPRRREFSSAVQHLGHVIEQGLILCLTPIAHIEKYEKAGKSFPIQSRCNAKSHHHATSHQQQ